MIIYVEEAVKNYPLVKKILNKFSAADKVFIKHYKNLFDKTISKSLEKSFVLAKSSGDVVLKAPDGYGHNNNQAYFFKTSLNCIFDCAYCYLKGAFKNEIPVYFVDYDKIKEDIKREILNKLEEIRKVKSRNDGKIIGIGNELSNLKSDYQYISIYNQFKSYKDAIWFYSSDYSDILGMNYISNFLEEFIPFFEKFDNVMMEIRTKSANIKPILDLGFVPKNTEFAFSLNPQELIDKYEKGTASLQARVNAINTLLDKGYKVGLRFLPLLPVRDYEKIYVEFVDYIKNKIDYKKISSTFVSGLLYTKQDYKIMLKKYPNLDILYMLEDDDGIFVREPRKVRDFFYNLFKKLDKKCFICLDS